MYVSAKIAVAIISTVFATSSGATCGSTCFASGSRLWPAPSARARLT